jgi:hypothetical protein
LGSKAATMITPITEIPSATRIPATTPGIPIALRGMPT